MALGPGLSMIGGFLNNARAFTGTALKWLGIGALGVGGAEALTNKDGKGGWPSKVWRGGSQGAAQEFSATQAIDAMFDGISYGANYVTSFVSGTLAQWLEVGAHFFNSPMLAGWAAKCRSFEQRSQDIVNNRVEKSRQNGADGDLNGPDAPGAKPDGSTYLTSAPSAPENDGLSGTQWGGGAALLAGGGLAAREVVNGLRGATPDAPTSPPSKHSALSSKSADSADDAMKILQRAQNGADDVVEAGARSGFVQNVMSRLSGLGSKIKMSGKYGAVASGVLVTAGGAYNWATGENPVVSSAEAAVPAPKVPPGAPAAAAATAESIASGEPSSAAETITVGGAAYTAAKVVGWRAVPIVGGVLTGYETLKNTAGYALNGEFKKAGTEFVAGGGLTISATGGFLTYGLGEAWHAAVRDGSAAAFGEDAKIGKAPLRALGESLTGYNTDMMSAAPSKPSVADFTSTIRNSPIKVSPSREELITDFHNARDDRKRPAVAPAPAPAPAAQANTMEGFIIQ